MFGSKETVWLVMVGLERLFSAWLNRAFIEWMVWHNITKLTDRRNPPSLSIKVYFDKGQHDQMMRSITLPVGLSKCLDARLAISLAVRREMEGCEGTCHAMRLVPFHPEQDMLEDKIPCNGVG